MSEVVNIATFQIRTGEIGDLTGRHGLATSQKNGHRRSREPSYLDPQIEPFHRTTKGAADGRELFLRLDRNNTPRRHHVDSATWVVDAFSVSRTDLDSVIREGLFEVPIYHATERASGWVALISLVDHRQKSFMRGEPADLVTNNEARTIQTLRAGDVDGTGIALTAIPEGSSIDFDHVGARRISHIRMRAMLADSLRIFPVSYDDSGSDRAPIPTGHDPSMEAGAAELPQRYNFESFPPEETE